MQHVIQHLFRGSRWVGGLCKEALFHPPLVPQGMKLYKDNKDNKDNNLNNVFFDHRLYSMKTLFLIPLGIPLCMS